MLIIGLCGVWGKEVTCRGRSSMGERGERMREGRRENRYER